MRCCVRLWCGRFLVCIPNKHPHVILYITTNLPYPTDTEIDWQTYNQQIALFVKGERDYKLISGSTGPLVYPGAHVWIYRVLYAVTDEGRNVVLAQVIFGAVYLLALAVVCACYRGAKVLPHSFSYKYILPR